jgi:hypothetical protein
MTDSSVGLMTSKVLPSTALTHSLLMKLSHWLAVGPVRKKKTGVVPRHTPRHCEDGFRAVLTYRPVGCSYSPECGVLSLVVNPDMMSVVWVSRGYRRVEVRKCSLCGVRGSVPLSICSHDNIEMENDAGYPAAPPQTGNRAASAIGSPPWDALAQPIASLVVGYSGGTRRRRGFAPLL